MSVKKKTKLLLKKFITLRKNVQNRPKILKFRKQKWQKLVLFLQNSGYLFYAHFDHNLILLFLFNNFVDNTFRNYLHVKQRFNYFYGGLRENYVKNVIKKLLKQNNLLINNSFINFFENRLDVILYRCNFVRSVKSARQLISHNCVTVNKKKITKNSFILKIGDLLEISPNYYKTILINIINVQMWPLAPKHLCVNYRTLQVIVVENPSQTNFYTLFPFWLNIPGIIRYYKR